MPISLAQPFIKDGRVKALGVTSKNRWPSMPNIPALAETQGLQKLDEDSWYGMLAPAGTPAAVIEKLSSALHETLKDPALIEKMSQAGLKPMSIESAAFSSLLQKERDNLVAAVKAAGIKPE
jgi:tripartite-type tricarboxylate transporter receptor subunit TctC